MFLVASEIVFISDKERRKWKHQYPEIWAFFCYVGTEIKYSPLFVNETFESISRKLNWFVKACAFFVCVISTGGQKATQISKTTKKVCENSSLRSSIALVVTLECFFMTRTLISFILSLWFNVAQTTQCFWKHTRIKFSS